MNIRRCLFSLFSVFVCLCVLLSTSLCVYATEISDLDTDINISNLEDEDLTNNNFLMSYTWYVNTTPYNIFSDFITNGTTKLGPSFEQSLSSYSTSTKFIDSFYFRLKDVSKMFSKGSSLDVEVVGIRNFNRIGDDLITFTNGNACTLTVSTVNSDGSMSSQVVENFNLKPIAGSNAYNISFSINNLDSDVYGVYLHLNYSIYAYNKLVNYVGTSNTMTHYGGTILLDMNFNEIRSDKTDGLLANIIQLVTNIKNGILNLPNFIANALKGFFDNIANGLVDLGNTILEGIKNLFIPSQQDIVNMKEDWEQLLASRFGALYEVIELIDDYANTFQSSSKGTITFPSVTIPLGDVDFVFGGWEVQVVPYGFDVLIGTLKSIISIACTVLFVNGLRNKFERLVTR